MNSDDTYDSPQVVSEEVAFLERHPEAGMVYADEKPIDESGVIIGQFDSRQTIYQQMLRVYDREAGKKHSILPLLVIARRLAYAWLPWQLRMWLRKAMTIQILLCAWREEQVRKMISGACLSPGDIMMRETIL